MMGGETVIQRDDIVVHSGDLLKTSRKKAGLTQKEAAELLHVAKRTLEDWEGGRRRPKQGEKYLSDCLLACGSLTQEARDLIKSGEWSMADAFDQHKITQVEKLSRWGRYGKTFSELWEKIPPEVVKACSPIDLARLIDGIKEAYDAGVAHGAKADC